VRWHPIVWQQLGQSVNGMRSDAGDDIFQPSERIDPRRHEATRLRSTAAVLPPRSLPKNFQQGNSFIVYPQVFEDRIGFQPNVSILDILFNMGPAASTLIENAV